MNCSIALVDNLPLFINFVLFVFVHYTFVHGVVPFSMRCTTRAYIPTSESHASIELWYDSYTKSRTPSDNHSSPNHTFLSSGRFLLKIKSNDSASLPSSVMGINCGVASACSQSASSSAPTPLARVIDQPFHL